MTSLQDERSEFEQEGSRQSILVQLENIQRRSKTINHKNKQYYFILVVVIILGVCFYFLQPPLSVCYYEVAIDIPEIQIEFKDNIEPYYAYSNDMTFSYPTVGVPTAMNKFNTTTVKKEDLSQFDQEFMQLLKPYNDTNCQYARYGMPNQGGYVLCKNFLAHSRALINIGVDGKDDFGCDLTSQFMMPNYQYDCTNLTAPTCSKDKWSAKFYPICVGQKTGKGKKHTFITLLDMVKRHNLSKKYWSLKIDISGGQNQAFRYFPEEQLQWIDQIVMDISLNKIYPEVWGMLDIYRTLAKHFVVVNFHQNNSFCNTNQEMSWRKLKSSAIEVTMVNRRQINIKKPTRSFVQQALNTNNNPKLLHC